MKEHLDVVIYFDKNWIVKQRCVFQDLPLSEVMDRIMGNMDAYETEYSMVVTIVDGGYEVVFSFIS